MDDVGKSLNLEGVMVPQDDDDDEEEEERKERERQFQRNFQKQLQQMVTNQSTPLSEAQVMQPKTLVNGHPFRYMNGGTPSIPVVPGHTNKEDDIFASNAGQGDRRHATTDLQHAYDQAGGNREVQLEILYEARGQEIEKLTLQLEETGKAYTRELRSLRHQIALLTSERDGLTVSLQSAQELLGEQKNQNIELLGRVQSLEVRLKALQDAKDEVTKELNTKCKVLDEVQRQLTETEKAGSLSRVKEEHQRIVGGLRAQNEKQVKDLLTDLEVLRQDLEKHWYPQKSDFFPQASEKASMQKQMADVVRGYEQKLAEKGETINRLSRNLEESQQQCTGLLDHGRVQELQTLKFNVNRLTQEKQVAEQTIKALKSEMDNLKTELSMQISAIKLGVTDGGGPSLKSQQGAPEMTVLQEELRRSLNINRVRRKEVETLKAELEMKNQDLSSLQAKVKDISEENQLLKMDLKQKTKDVTTLIEKTKLREGEQLLKKQLQEVEEELEAASKRSQAAEQELGRLKQRMTSLQEEKEQAVRRMQENLEAIHQEALEQVRQQAEVKWHGEVGRLQSQLNAVNKSLDDVKSMYVKACEEKTQAEEEGKKLAVAELEAQYKAAYEQRNSAIMKRLAEFESKTKEERDRLKKDLERLNRENEVLRKREGEWKEGIVKYKQELDAELQTNHDLLHKEKEELQHERETLAEKVTQAIQEEKARASREYQRQMEMLKKSHEDEMRSLSQHFQKQLATMQNPSGNQVSMSSAKHRRLTETVTKIAEDFQEMKGRRSAEVDELKLKLEFECRDKERLQQKLKKLDSHIKSLETHYKDELDRIGAAYKAAIEKLQKREAQTIHKVQSMTSVRNHSDPPLLRTPSSRLAKAAPSQYAELSKTVASQYAELTQAGERPPHAKPPSIAGGASWSGVPVVHSPPQKGPGKGQDGFLKLQMDAMNSVHRLLDKFSKPPNS
ncbi:unnamed protein product [Darwinula stevensoni]|uniref:Uncharacterized protein n=1 Tax=Darwinula stevensoni TaxID=69355 RepID=A0A7R8XI12_9CRUS|nr:unnamed protein product [Darwinula stevensoni]CAG0892994.1 unnamed protein product [Darwinula stevensoni]